MNDFIEGAADLMSQMESDLKILKANSIVLNCLIKTLQKKGMITNEEIEQEIRDTLGSNNVKSDSQGAETKESGNKNSEDGERAISPDQSERGTSQEELQGSNPVPSV